MPAVKGNTRQSQRRRELHNYAEVDNGVRAEDSKYTRALEHRFFDEAKFETVEGHEVTRQFLIETGFPAPVLVKDAAGLGLSMPPESFSVDEIVRLVGGERDMNVIEVATQQEIEGYNLYQFGYYFKHPRARRRTLNVISLEVSGTPLGDIIQRPTAVRDLDWVDRVWPTDSDLVLRPKVQLYCLLGVAGCFTDFHIDFGGSSVFYHVVKGHKVFLFVPPTPANIARYEQWTASPTQSDVFFTDMLAQGECKQFHIRTGETLFIPSGWIHAVFTPTDTIVFGGNFLHDLSIPMQIDISRIEARTKVPQTFRYPFFRRSHWYVAMNMTQRLLLGTHSPHYLSLLLTAIYSGKGHKHSELTEVELAAIPRLIQFLSNILDRRAEAAFHKGPPPPDREEEGFFREDELPYGLWGEGARIIAELKTAYAGEHGGSVLVIDTSINEDKIIADDDESPRKRSRRKQAGSPSKRTPSSSPVKPEPAAAE
mgnify:CR=1 FL=1